MKKDKHPILRCISGQMQTRNKNKAEVCEENVAYRVSG